MPPFVFLNQLQICSAEKKYARKKYGNYDPLLLKFLALPQAIMFFWFRTEIWTSVDAMTFSFAHRLILEHHWPRGPNEIFAPRPEISLGAPGRSQEFWLGGGGKLHRLNRKEKTT